MISAKNTSNPLTNDMVQDTNLAILTIRISRSEKVSIVVTSRVNNEVILTKHTSLPAAATRAKALQELIYENPLLTADFHKVNIVADNNRFFAIAHTEDVNEEISRRIEALWPHSLTGVEITPVVMSVDNNTDFVSTVDHDIYAFARRTWSNTSFHNPLAVLTRYFSLKNSLGNMGKVHVVMESQQIHIMAFARDGLVVTNTFAAGNVNDATYYILATCKYAEFDPDTDRLYIHAASNNATENQTSPREALTNSLRQFIPNVLPEILPAEIAQNPHCLPLDVLLLPLI